MTRLALGTAQFGQAYGVANTSGQIRPCAVAEILELAGSQGVDTLDTAIAYGASETCLGDAGVASWRVITKLPALPDGVSNVSAWVEMQVHGSLQRLRVPQLEGLLLHRPTDLLGRQGGRLQRALDALKSRGWIRSTGVSIYDPGELDLLWGVWRTDIVQAPFNVLDRRLVSSGWLARLSKHGVRVHLRSLFLQGLLLMPPSQRPAWFASWRELLDRWSSWCSEHSVPPLQAALACARRLTGVERLVVGVDSVTQLQEVLAADSLDAPVPPDELLSEDRELIEPSHWRLA